MTTDTLIESSTATSGPGDLLAIDAETADRLFRAAHTTHAFSDEPVTDAQIQAAWDLVRWAPTSMNILPLRLLVVRTPEAKQRLGVHMADFNRDKTLAAPVTIIAAADPAFHRHLPTLAPFREGLADQLDPQTELREGMARTNALIQIGYLIVGLRAAGLSVGPMTGFDAAGIDAEFFGESGWRTLVAINVGYPADEGAHFPRQARLDFHQVAEVL
ncbi:malonic semialdehyde reductase [Cellulosimicrobium sp. BIT-GX5]|uniref:Malonic semialdehyde reductase n=1 Tax=Cellulosimicrobium composti TaxID=2672572 RepID=A0A6N7ZFI2_9MICO|nr:malonic semialdehyde reductase [Cellulosimicrobium composti]MTG88214.1 malonic semialdehyde reductase [Cellulosimicrobium composti]